MATKYFRIRLCVVKMLTDVVANYLWRYPLDPRNPSRLTKEMQPLPGKRESGSWFVSTRAAQKFCLVPKNLTNSAL